MNVGSHSPVRSFFLQAFCRVGKELISFRSLVGSLHIFIHFLRLSLTINGLHCCWRSQECNINSIYGPFYFCGTAVFSKVWFIYVILISNHPLLILWQPQPARPITSSPAVKLPTFPVALLSASAVQGRAKRWSPGCVNFARQKRYATADTKVTKPYSHF